MKHLRCTLLVLVITLVAAGWAGAFDLAVSFNDYSDGAVAGQFGWEDDNLTDDPEASGYPVATIIDDPTDSGRGKVMSLFHENWDTYWTGIFLPVGDLVGAGNKFITLAWDQYRTDFLGFVSTSEHPDYDNWSSNQLWDSIFVDALQEPSGTLVANTWQSVWIDFDVDAMTAVGYVDGAQFATAYDVPLGVFRGIGFQIATLDGTRTEDLYIDNIMLSGIATTGVPEPGSILALAAGLAGLAGMARRRKRS